MSDFNIHAWKKNQYLAEAGLGSSQAQSLANLIDDAIMKVDESLSYRDFAIAVAIILKEEYGSHNFGKFMEVLHAELGINEGLIKEFGEYKDAQDELNKELSKEFSSARPYISLGMYAGGRPDSDPLKDKGYGDITFRINGELSDQEWNKALKWVESKGWEVTDESNWYDYEPGERYWYPKIKFQFNTVDYPPTNA
jgi:hypothetical protein